jgi:ABC-type transporter Mla MlaB component
LLGYHDNRLDGELPVAVVEQVLQAGAEKVNNEDVVQALLAKVVNIRDAGWAMLARAGEAAWWCGSSQQRAASRR